MFSVSDVAQQRIAEYFQAREISPIRVFFDAGG
jgi:hypothetical protein